MSAIPLLNSCMQHDPSTYRYVGMAAGLLTISIALYLQSFKVPYYGIGYGLGGASIAAGIMVSPLQTYYWRHQAKKNEGDDGKFIGVPDELIVEIFSHLELRDLEAVSCVNKKFERLSGKPFLWQRALKKQFPSGHYVSRQAYQAHCEYQRKKKEDEYRSLALSWQYPLFSDSSFLNDSTRWHLFQNMH